MKKYKEQGINYLIYLTVILGYFILYNPFDKKQEEPSIKSNKEFIYQQF
jgi:hypothetical protein